MAFKILHRTQPFKSTCFHRELVTTIENAIIVQAHIVQDVVRLIQVGLAVHTSPAHLGSARHWHLLHDGSAPYLLGLEVLIDHYHGVILGILQKLIATTPNLAKLLFGICNGIDHV